MNLFWICLVLIVATTGLATTNANPVETKWVSALPKVRYILIRKNSNTYKDLCEASFNTNTKTRVFVHGFNVGPCIGHQVEHNSFRYDPEVGQVMFVDWTKYATAKYAGFNYFTIITNTLPKVAKDLAKAVHYIKENTNGPVELVGHSLGAHLVGQAGRQYKELYGEPLDRVIGLDPAGPLFHRTKKAIKCTDAANVTVLHTDTFVMGLSDRICEDDVYETNPEACKGKGFQCAHNYAMSRYMDYLKGIVYFHEGKVVYNDNFVDRGSYYGGCRIPDNLPGCS